jgi:hypothetical protein
MRQLAPKPKSACTTLAQALQQTTQWQQQPAGQNFDHKPRRRKLPPLAPDLAPANQFEAALCYNPLH